MSLTPQQLAELDSLLSDLADERLSEERRLALESLLQAEPKARDCYIRFQALCSDLHEFAATSLSAEDETVHVDVSLRDAMAGLGETGHRRRVAPRHDSARGASGLRCCGLGETSLRGCQKPGFLAKAGLFSSAWRQFGPSRSPTPLLAFPADVLKLVFVDPVSGTQLVQRFSP